jgi:hypothetical protein
MAVTLHDDMGAAGAVSYPRQGGAMETAINTAIDHLFADPNLAKDAVYAPVDGDTFTVRVIARRPDALTDFGDAKLWSATAVFDLPVREVPNPRPGDRLALGDEIFIIQGEPVRDSERLVWTLDVRPA